MQPRMEFIVPHYINRSTCFERYTAHHQELWLYMQSLVYNTLVKTVRGAVCVGNHETSQQVSLETSLQFYQTTQCHIIQDRSLYNHRHVRNSKIIMKHLELFIMPFFLGYYSSKFIITN